MAIKKQMKEALFQLGYKINHITPNELGYDPFRDMSLLTGNGRRAVIFDVGANVGQSILAFRERFSSPIIHAFEPGSSAFESMKTRTQGMSDVHLNHCALGSQHEHKVLIENSKSVLNSLLPPGKEAPAGEVVGKTEVEVESLDNYCSRAGITHIDVLKSDTQGFELEVLKGSLNMLRQHKIHLLYLEMHFGDSYEGMPKFEDVYLFLRDLGLRPMCFYNQCRRDSHLTPLAEIDGLFIDTQWQPA